jgi:hypothetical protein
MPEEAESSASTLSHNKRARGGNDDGDVGLVEEKDRASQEETRKAEEDAVERACQRWQQRRLLPTQMPRPRQDRRRLRRP